MKPHWPFWQVTVTVELTAGGRHLWQWSELQAATMDAAMRRAPRLAAMQMRREKIAGRSNVKYMKVEVVKETKQQQEGTGVERG